VSNCAIVTKIIREKRQVAEGAKKGEAFKGGRDREIGRGKGEVNEE